jgi:L-fuculose-phosphate aldolase
MSVRDELVAAGRRLVAAGLSPGSTGNISARDGEDILITGTGAELGRLEESSFARVSLDGEHRGGARASKETPLHLGLYRRDPAHGAVIHLHSPHAVAMSCMTPWADHNAVPPLTPYFVMRVGQTPLLPYRHPGDPALGDDVHDAPWPMRAALLANHGAVVAGGGVDDALDRATELEEACRIAGRSASWPSAGTAPGRPRPYTEAGGTAWPARLP